jgi:hypothetical protein
MKSKKIKIGRISTGVLDAEGGLFPDIMAVLPIEFGEWMPFDKAKEIFDSISIKNFMQKESVNIDCKLTPSTILFEFQLEGIFPHAHLFSYEVDEFVWENREKLAKMGGYEYPHEYITDLTGYDWNEEAEKSYRLTTETCDKIKAKIKRLEMIESFIEANSFEIQLQYMTFSAETGNEEKISEDEFAAFYAIETLGLEDEFFKDREDEII